MFFLVCTLVKEKRWLENKKTGAIKTKTKKYQTNQNEDTDRMSIWQPNSIVSIGFCVREHSSGKSNIFGTIIKGKCTRVTKKKNEKKPNQN